MTSFKTVAEAIANIHHRWPENGYTFQNLKGRETTFTFAEIERLSAARAAKLQGLGLGKGDRMAMAIIEPQDFVLTFFAALRIGVIAVPMYPPISLGNIKAYAKQAGRILKASETSVLVVSAKLKYIFWSMLDEVPSLRKVVPVESLQDTAGEPDYPEIGPEDIAFLQFTSGSTMAPRGVIVPHRGLISNTIGIMGPTGLQMDPTKDKGVTWLPLYHDMGLIGFVIATVVWGVSVIFIPTLRFLRRPAVWMETLHRHRGTTSFGPNFSYALATRKVTDEELDSWDLSCVKVFGCGGEPVNPTVIRAFTELYHARTGLPENAVRPGYGLAEGMLTTSLTPMEHGLKTIRIDAERFQNEGIVQPVRNGCPALEHVACGRIIPDHEVLVEGPKGEMLPEGREGQILMKGPSVSPGYYQNPEASREVFREGCLLTGDLGYLLDGYIYVTGRIKDLIIYNGRNIHPQEVEWAAGAVKGVRKGNVIAFSLAGGETERLVIILETREGRHEGLIDQVKTAIQSEFSLPVSEVVCLPPGAIPKTSSGKLQRWAARDHFVKGTLGAHGGRNSGAKVQHTELVGHMARSVWSRVKSNFKSAST